MNASRMPPTFLDQVVRSQNVIQIDEKSFKNVPQGEQNGILVVQNWSLRRSKSAMGPSRRLRGLPRAPMSKLYEP